MRLSRIIIAVFIIAVVAIVGIFTVSTKDVVAFNDGLVKDMTSMDKAFEKYGEELVRYCEGEKVEEELLNQERENISRITHEIQNRVKGMEVPDDELCREFHAAVANYMNNAAEFSEKYKELNAYIKEHNPGSEEDVDYVASEMDSLLEKDKSLMAKAQAIQKKMAKKYDFTLK